MGKALWNHTQDRFGSPRARKDGKGALVPDGQWMIFAAPLRGRERRCGTIHKTVLVRRALARMGNAL